MARLTRKNIKVFAGSATNNGVFGSLQAGHSQQTTDVEQIQSLPAWEEGWNAATMTAEKLPPLEEFQGVQYVTTYQQAYIMQEGIPEWSATVTYYKGSVTKQVTDNGFILYSSKQDDNIGFLPNNTSYWTKVFDSSDPYAFSAEVDNRINTLLSALYPVGSLYIGTQTVCPMSALISNSTWELVSAGKALWTGAGSNANTTIDAGLPNITGSFQALQRTGTTAVSGAFTRSTGTVHTGSSHTPSDDSRGGTINFNASRSSSIYGKSTTVQPPAYVVNVWRRTA